MIAQEKLLKLLLLRRRLESQAFVKPNASIKTILYNKLELYRTLGISGALVYTDSQLWSYLENLIPQFANDNGLLVENGPVEVPTAMSGDFYPSWFETLESFSERLEAVQATLIVQGSYADGLITNYSDLDLVIFYTTISPKLIELKNKLEKFILEIDPIQHHGVFMIAKNKFSAYWQMDLPVEVIARSRCFGNSNKILDFQMVISDVLGPKRSVENTLITIERFVNSDYSSIGIYAWKLLLSQIMLIPTLYLAAKGQSVYKRESFAIVKKYYSDQAWEVITQVSDIRDSWPALEIFEHYKSKRVTSTHLMVNDDLKIIDVPEISVGDLEAFYSNLRLFINETRQAFND